MKYFINTNKEYFSFYFNAKIVCHARGVTGTTRASKTVQNSAVTKLILRILTV